jgi:hypothetical protein
MSVARGSFPIRVNLRAVAPAHEVICTYAYYLMSALQY